MQTRVHSLVFSFPRSTQSQCACRVPGLAASSYTVWPVSNFASFEEDRGKIKLSEDAQLACGTLILADPWCYSHGALGNLLLWFNTAAFELVLTLALVGWNS